MLNEMILCEELFHTPTGVAFLIGPNRLLKNSF